MAFFYGGMHTERFVRPLRLLHVALGRSLMSAFLLVRFRREVVEVCLIYTCVVPCPLYEALEDQTDIQGLPIARKETGSTYYYSIGTH